MSRWCRRSVRYGAAHADCCACRHLLLLLLLLLLHVLQADVTRGSSCCLAVVRHSILPVHAAIIICRR
jgi:hypothetical protein